MVSFILLIITSPLLLTAAILIKMEDGGPIFYKQVRNGLSKKEFEIIKLRTMNRMQRWTEQNGRLFLIKELQK